MDSIQTVTLREFAQKVLHRNYIATRNEVKVDRENPGRGVLTLQHAVLPVFRLGRNWLVREADVHALINPAPASTTAAPAAPARRAGRPRKEATATQERGAA
ncbi:MAG: hypothetical protein PHO64_08655 [Thiomonas sp.]|nr:hypothetical protein [Thiomonas sp.]